MVKINKCLKWHVEGDILEKNLSAEEIDPLYFVDAEAALKIKSKQKKGRRFHEVEEEVTDEKNLGLNSSENETRGSEEEEENVENDQNEINTYENDINEQELNYKNSILKPNIILLFSGICLLLGIGLSVCN